MLNRIIVNIIKFLQRKFGYTPKFICIHKDLWLWSITSKTSLFEEAGYLILVDDSVEKTYEVDRSIEEFLRSMNGNIEKVVETEVEKAVRILTKAIKEDPDFYYSYQANIAVAFQDEAERQNSEDPFEKIYSISNEAAKNFLDLWCR
ncbi:MAG: hypothetical protein GY861_22305 [bacterium]|nr:hypothetical protein [bacterium]